MSIIYGKAPLSSGYWLSRIWYLENLISNNQTDDKSFLGKITAYIVLSGLLVVFLNLISFRFKYSTYAIFELFKVTKSAMKHGFFLRTIINIPKIVINRISRNKNKLTPI